MDARLCVAQIDGKTWNLGCYEVEADAARVYDKVASILGRSTNFSKPEKIYGQRTPGADDCITKAVEAANAFLAGDCWRVNGA